MQRTTKRGLLVCGGLAVSAVSLLGTAALSACDTGDAASPQNLANRDAGLGTTTETDGGTVAEAAADAGDAGATDTGADVVVDAGLNGCSTFTDHTADPEVDLTWDFSISMQNDRCTKIAVGSSVKWTGDFGTHPLQAFGGDTPSPITTVSSGATPDTVVFPAAGVFGYHCQNHPNRMFGVVIVIDPNADAGGD